jgi:DNA-binding SARP family transcriptional activator
VYQQILQLDSCREETAMQLMKLAARYGNHRLIRSTFEQLNAALRSLGASPTPATLACYQQLS